MPPRLPCANVPGGTAALRQSAVHTGPPPVAIVPAQRADNCRDSKDPEQECEGSIPKLDVLCATPVPAPRSVYRTMAHTVATSGSQPGPVSRTGPGQQ